MLYRTLPLALLVCIATTSISQAGPLGIRRATADVSYLTASVHRLLEHLDDTLTDVRGTCHEIDSLLNGLDGLVELFGPLIEDFRRQGFVEVEFRRKETVWFQVRVYLPPVKN